MFSTLETSRDRGQPVTLYRFEVGPSIYAYTDAEQAVTHDALIYEPIPVNRGSVTTDGTDDKSELSVDVARGTEVGELLLSYPPSSLVFLVVIEGHIAENGDFFVRESWRGTVQAASRRGDEVTFSCRGSDSLTKHPGLRRHFQHGCPHVLYGPQCRANKINRTVEVPAASISGATFTLAAGWNGAVPFAKYRGGLCEWTNGSRQEIRTVVGATATSVQVGGVIRGADAGTVLSISAGCNRWMDDCRDIHFNILNFGGFPWIPTQNPFGFSSQYY